MIKVISECTGRLPSELLELYSFEKLTPTERLLIDFNFCSEILREMKKGIEGKKKKFRSVREMILERRKRLNLKEKMKEWT